MVEKPLDERQRGILGGRPDQWRFGLDRLAPEPALRPFVEYYWLVTWDLRGQRPHSQRVIPDPAVHLVFGDGDARVVGVNRGAHDQLLRDEGRVLGVRFQPGGFRPFLHAPVATITGRRLEIQEVFGEAGNKLDRAVRDAPDGAGMVALIDEFLVGTAPDPDPVGERAAEIVRLIATDPSVVGVGDLATRCGLSARGLQRMFAEYVGVGPKWVISRYRMHEAAERIAAHPDLPCGALAADLGYADQAHFTRDFTAAVGQPPARYARGVAGRRDALVTTRSRRP